MPAKGFKISHKVCNTCKQDLPRANFYEGKEGITPNCKKCFKAWAKASNKANKNKYTAFQRKKRYGVTPEQYDALFAAQGGVCAGCKKLPTENKALSLDHNHETGQVRGLLCHNCNIALGLLKDNVSLLQTLIDYLNRYRT